LREPASQLLLSKTVFVPKKTHVIAKALQLLYGALEVPVPVAADYEFPIGINEAHRSEALEVAGNQPYVILNPGGGWPTKLWSADRFGLLADELWHHFGLESLVTSGPGEDDLAATVARASRTGKARSVRTSLKGFFALAKGARGYVGGDTGPTHLAIAAGTPVVGLFGPTEWWRNGSPKPEDICVERTDIDCRVDCHRRACANWICMDIDVDRVFQAVAERLRRAGLSQLKHATNGN
jgi:ADP-heptose:LPS heptosyltransferase